MDDYSEWRYPPEYGEPDPWWADWSDEEWQRWYDTHPEPDPVDAQPPIETIDPGTHL